MLLAEPLTERMMRLAIEVHPRVKPGDHTGPGLLESAYEQCLCHELSEAGISFSRRAAIRIMYKDVPVGDAFEADIVVAGQLIREIKTVTTVLAIHEVQLRTYLRMSNIRVGLLLNFNVPRLVGGLRRTVV
jgi:GxxExxY protein